MADISSYIRTQLNSFVLEVQGTKSGPGTPVVINAQQSPTSKNQLWTIEADGHIRSRLNGLVLDIQSRPFLFHSITDALGLAQQHLCHIRGSPKLD